MYVDLRPRDAENELALNVLRSRLLGMQPTQRVLDRLTPINGGRVLVEIDDTMALGLFRGWLLSAMARIEALRMLLAPLGPRLRLLGAQLIVPKVTEHEPRVVAQMPHTDVGVKGEVVSVAIHLDLNDQPMGTLIDAAAHLANGTVTDGRGFGRAMTPVFIYDTGVVHAGPGVAFVPPPYPHYFTNRAFVLLCPDTLDPRQITQHRRENGLRGAIDLTIDIR